MDNKINVENWDYFSVMDQKYYGGSSHPLRLSNGLVIQVIRNGTQSGHFGTYSVEVRERTDLDKQYLSANEANTYIESISL